MQKTSKRTVRTLTTVIMFVALLLTSHVSTAEELHTLINLYESPDALRKEIATFATSDDLIGVKYVSKGMSPSGFDCSGFVCYVYANFGIELPHGTKYLKKEGIEVSKEDLKPGDLVFTRNYHHVGIYIGDGLMVHASSGKGKVVISSIEEGYYYDHYDSARRIF